MGAAHSHEISPLSLAAIRATTLALPCSHDEAKRPWQPEDSQSSFCRLRQAYLGLDFRSLYSHTRSWVVKSCARGHQQDASRADTVCSLLANCIPTHSRTCRKILQSQEYLGLSAFVKFPCQLTIEREARRLSIDSLVATHRMNREINKKQKRTDLASCRSTGSSPTEPVSSMTSLLPPTQHSYFDIHDTRNPPTLLGAQELFHHGHPLIKGVRATSSCRERGSCGSTNKALGGIKKANKLDSYFTQGFGTRESHQIQTSLTASEQLKTNLVVQKLTASRLAMVGSSSKTLRIQTWITEVSKSCPTTAVTDVPPL